MKKLIILVVALLVVATMAGAGTFAYFTNTETSTGNSFTSGTFDVKLAGGTQNGDSVIGTWVSPSNWAPGQTVNGTLSFTNAGSINASHVYFMFKNLQHNGGADGSNMMEKIIVTNLQERFERADGTSVTTSNQAANLAAQVGNHDSTLTLAEFAGFAENWYGYYTYDDQSGDGICVAGGDKTDYDLILGLTFDPDAGNEYQGDTCSFDFYANTTQNSPTDGLIKLHE